jgi:hypothetical protein
MRNLSKPLINLLLLFATMFVINFVVMYVLFDINVINPVKRTGLNDSSSASKKLVEAVNPSVNENGKSVGDDQIGDEAAESQEAANENGTLRDEAENEAAYYMTSDEVGFLEDLSLVDKLEALSLISKVGKEESDKIYDIASDGVTIAEMEEIKNILEKHLSQKEMDTLNGILDKNKLLYAGQNTRNK